MSANPGFLLLFDNNLTKNTKPAASVKNRVVPVKPRFQRWAHPPLIRDCRFRRAASRRQDPVSEGASAMHDYGFFSYESKDEFIEKSKSFWNPGKTQSWQDFGVDLVIDRREEYFLWDMSG